MLELRYDAECLQKQVNFERWVRAHAALRAAELLPLLRAEEPLFYRTSLKVPLGARSSRDGAPKVVAGFYRPGTHRIVDLNVCAVQHPSLVRLLIGVRQAATELGIPVDAPGGRPGLLRHLVARVGLGTGEILAGLVVRRAGDPVIRRLAETLLARFRPSGLVGVVENLNSAGGPWVLGRHTLPLAGASTLTALEDGLAIETSLTTFVQVNAAQAQRLYAEIVSWLAPLAGQRVLDLYCGYGPIGLRLARAGADVRAIERDPNAAAEGRRAAERNGLTARIAFEAGDASLLTPDVPVNAIIVDPPRAGLAPEFVQRLLSAPPERLLYVSCNPRTLLCDLTHLAQRFAVRRLRPVDLFPRTRHLEALALLERQP